MPRLPEIAEHLVAPQDRQLLSADIFRVLLHNAPTARAFNAFTRHFRVGALDPKLLELAILQVGYSGKSLYIYGRHLQIGLDVGLSDAEITSVAQDTKGEKTCFSLVQTAVVRAARELTLGADISEVTFDALKKGLPLDAFIDLIVAISWYVGLLRIMTTLRMSMEDKFQPLIERFPLD